MYTDIIPRIINFLEFQYEFAIKENESEDNEELST